jgi:hypothetical protein
MQPGEDLLAALASAGLRNGWAEAFITGTGTLELCELGGEGATVTLEQAHVASLAGRARREGDGCAVSLVASLVCSDKLHAGALLAAVSGDLLLVVDVVPLAAAATASAPLPPARAPAPSTPDDSARPATAPLSATFSKKPIIARRPSAGPSDEEDDEPQPHPEPGEWLDHPQLGLCEVVGDDASGGTRIRIPSGRVATLKLDALRVLPFEADAEGRAVYKIAGPRKRDGM